MSTESFDISRTQFSEVAHPRWESVKSFFGESPESLEKRALLVAGLGRYRQTRPFWELSNRRKRPTPGVHWQTSLVNFRCLTAVGLRMGLAFGMGKRLRADTFLRNRETTCLKTPGRVSARFATPT